MDNIYEALAEKNRRLILTLVKENEGITVSKLKEMINFISQPTLSNHLAILKKAGLVEWKVDGKWRKYYLKKDNLELLIGELSKFIGYGNITEIGMS